MPQHRTIHRTGRSALIALAAAWLLAVLPAQAYVPDALQRAVDEFRLSDANRLLARRNAGDVHTLYLAGRVAVLSYDVQRAAAAAAACTAAFPRDSRCHELDGDQLALAAVMESGSLAQLRLARRARDAWLQAVELDPANSRARLQLVRWYSLAPWMAGGSKRRARQHLDTLISTDQALAELGRGYYAFYGGDHAAAATHFRAVLAQEPQHADAGYHLALAEAELGNADAAVAQLNGVVMAFPEFWDAWFHLGTLAARTRDGSQHALNALLTFIDGAPRAGAKRLANAWHAIGRLFEDRGADEEARVAYRQALAEKPGHNESGAALQRLETRDDQAAVTN